MPRRTPPRATLSVCRGPHNRLSKRNSNSVRILVVNYEYPPVGGGGGRVAEDLCRGLTERGHSLRVVTSHVSGLERNEVRDGVEIVRAFAGRKRLEGCTPFQMATYLPGAVGRTLYDLATWRPDVMHVHFAVPSGPVAWFAHQVSHVPYVLTAHLGDVPGGVPEQTDRMFRLIKPMTTPIWNAAAHVTAVSEFTRRLAEQAYGRRVETVFNGVDVERCLPGEAAPPPCRRLLFAGRLSIQKNVLFLIDFLAEVRDLPWRLDMLGDGPLRSEVESRIAEHGLGDRIRLHGWVSPEDVERRMADGDVLLLPSLSEGLSVVGVRALAYGLAVLASDIGGNVDLVEPGRNGRLVPLTSTAAFADALRKMLADENRLAEMKRASRERARQFDLRRIVDRYEEIFRSIVERRQVA